MEPKISRQTQDFANEVRRLLDGIAKNNEAYEAACVNFFGVTTSQGGTLLSIPLKNKVRMNELSQAVGVDNSTMTRMVDQLIEKGLVFRQNDEKDRRSVGVGLTEGGQKLHKELNQALRNFYKDSLDEIGEDERAVILQSLGRLKEALNKGLENCCKRYCGH